MLDTSDHDNHATIAAGILMLFSFLGKAIAISSFLGLVLVLVSKIKKENGRFFLLTTLFLNLLLFVGGMWLVFPEFFRQFL